MENSVAFLLNNLQQLGKYQFNLISNAKTELDDLQKDLVTLKAILKDASEKYKKSEAFRVWEKEIRDVAYDAEDIIDNCIIKMAKEKDMNLAKRKIVEAGRTSLAQQVMDIRANKVKPLMTGPRFEIAKLSIADVDGDAVDGTRDIRQLKRENNIVGFKDETNTLISHLNKESDALKVISIVGMPGLGKTTVAWKIFKDPKIEYEFHTRIWVDISEDVDMKNVLLTIQTHFTKPKPEMTVDQLTEDVKSHLQKNKFLIVMDDVWTSEAWNQIKTCLPMSYKYGRVLITSRTKNVATRVNHMLRFLTPEESWELLQYEVYGNLKEADKELIEVGQVIARLCDGLPLSIIVIGGILADKRSKVNRSLSSIKEDWEEVAESIHTYLVYEDKTKRLENIISLSYAKMPYELKSCFLYLGIFREDAEILAKKLTLLWIAEGFIEDVPHKRLEDVARDKLNDLINRNLIMVVKAKPNGDVKTCRVHDTIREFCKRVAAGDKQNLYQEIVYQGVFKPPLESVETSCRRLCIHSYVYEFLLRKPEVLKARSFLCFPKGPINLDKGDVSYFTNAFSVLRVLDAENIKFPNFPKLKKLFFLKYLTLAIANDHFKSIPKIIYDLKNLQTLILDVTSRTIEITSDIWKLTQMRHLKTKASIIVKNKGEGEGGENLQTLGRLSPESCTSNVLGKAKNLVTLGVQGDLSTLVDFNCVGKLDHLNKLKLVHDVYNALESEQPLRRLPEPSSFPPNLRILVLEGSCLGWDQMSILGRLGYLEVLKLKDNAFKGKYWSVTGNGFGRLEHLHIERADLMSWRAPDDAFPKLTSLYLKNCDKLMGAPENLVKNLKKAYMSRVTPELVTQFENILQPKEEEPEQHRAKRTKLEIEEEPLQHRAKRTKLEIAPTDKP